MKAKEIVGQLAERDGAHVLERNASLHLVAIRLNIVDGLVRNQQNALLHLVALINLDYNVRENNGRVAYSRHHRINAAYRAWPTP